MTEASDTNDNDLSTDINALRSELDKTAKQLEVMTQQNDKLWRMLEEKRGFEPTYLDRQNLSEEEKHKIQERINGLGKWFSQFHFGQGIRTPRAGCSIDYFRERAVRIFSAIEKHVEPSQSVLLDVGCADGFFPIEGLKRGFKKVIGVDPRPENIERCKLAAELHGFGNAEFLLDNIYELDIARDQKFDVVVCQGVFYHLSDPVRAMEKIFGATQTVAMVAGWTSAGEDETFKLSQEDEKHFLNGDRPILAIPTRNAKEKLMQMVGFSEVYEIQRPNIAATGDWREFIGLT
ncbi:MAG: hypothetical protein CMM44_07585 [Rhodospirillaceae bacterium]|nr:hypothetical protein [Rhodospirillaceae bacterium]|tara:strand:- start:6532 stop:7404 length:873 start_codon:yes stop_codon:yes gene_type:complete